MHSVKKVSIIIPVYNEANYLKRSLARVVKAKLSVKKEIIIVDDGSTDDTKHVIANILTNDMKLVSHKQNQGKGAAIKSGLKEATGDYVIVHDADLEYYPDDIESLIRCARKNSADVVLGSRNLNPNNTYLYELNYFGVKIMSALFNLLHPQNRLTDPETCYKLVKTNLLKGLDLQEKGFGVEIEITAKLSKQRLTMFEVPIRYSPRSYSNGKKIKWTDGIWGLWLIFRYTYFLIVP